jgi:hypothetical protein
MAQLVVMYKTPTAKAALPRIVSADWAIRVTFSDEAIRGSKLGAD